MISSDCLSKMNLNLGIIFNLVRYSQCVHAMKENMEVFMTNYFFDGFIIHFKGVVELICYSRYYKSF